MLKKTILILAGITVVVIACNQKATTDTTTVASLETTPKEMYELNGYSTEIAWGEHLVAITGCDDCHSPKKMTEKGPAVDVALRLSGHPTNDPPTKFDRKVMEENGYGACNPHMTAWSGPWGMSYAGNLTSDATGIGNWTKEQFFTAIRKGKLKGMENGRDLLPPMPWFNYANMTDAELSAMFAYLKTVPPVENVVPAPMPPLAAMTASK